MLETSSLIVRDHCEVYGRGWSVRGREGGREGGRVRGRRELRKAWSEREEK